MTAEIIQKKKSPCNECRDKKRKCSYGQPCERCLKSGINCVYIYAPSPKDVEYIQELERMKEIEAMQYQIASMEKELAALKLAQSSNITKTTTVLQNYPSPISLHKSNIPKKKQQQQQQQQQHNYKHIINQQQPWTVTLKNGQVSINTHLTQHSDLMSLFYNNCIQSKRLNQLPIPLHSMPMAQQNAMGMVMSIMIWRRYSKTRYKSFTAYKPLALLEKTTQDQVSKIIPADELVVITFRLVSVYLQCSHFIHFGVYIPAFLDIYLKGDVLKSPVVMAFCSVICYQFCKHLMTIIPNEAQPEYAVYYFEQARELIADKFDDVDLDTMITFGLMAIYKLKRKDGKEAVRYLQMAERIRDLLEPVYPKDDGATPESCLFYRFQRFLFHCRATIELYSNVDKLDHPRISPKKLFEYLDVYDNIPLTVYAHDSEQEKQFINMKTCIAQLKKVIKDGGKFAVASDYPTFISVFGHHIEMGMRHWYRSILPAQFQLSLPLFEDDISDLDFFTALEKECGDSPFAVLTTIKVYHEFIIMAKSYIPKDPKIERLETEDLVEKFKKIQTNPYHEIADERIRHWFKLIAKIKYFRQYKQDIFTQEEMDESDEEYFVRFIRAMDPSNLSFDMPVTHTAIKASFNTVKLCQFLLTKDYGCHFDARWVFSAWDMLMIAAQFKYQQPGDKTNTMDRIRANLLICIDIFMIFVDYSSRHPNLTNFIQELQEEFNRTFYSNS